jgi:hypothetical protein
LVTGHEKDKITQGLWTSLAAADHEAAQSPLHPPEQPSEANDNICNRILEGLEFHDMRVREGQIKEPFPDTFKWLLKDETPEESSRPSVRFREWLESKVVENPFWITGKPASGKSTLMKSICNEPQVQKHLAVWSGEFRLLTCRAYFWYPGSSEQKSQLGLLRTLLSQLLHQRRDLCRHIVARRYLYFHLAGVDAPDPPKDWTLDEIQDLITRILSRIEGTGRVAMFVDGLDELDGNHEELVSFLKTLHSHFRIKLCVSSRP